jgi:hypothetical protein
VPADRSVVVALTVVLSSVTEPVLLVRSTVEPLIVEPEAVLRSAAVAVTDSVVPAVELFNVTADVDWSVTEAEVPALSVKDVALVSLMLIEPLVAEAVKLLVSILPPLI